MKLEGTKTEKNLEKAFAGESQARNKYTYFASAAKKEGYEQVAEIFLKTAENEKEHAKLWAKELGLIGKTADNLAAAAAGEHEEWVRMYKKMAKVAREEGFTDIAVKFENVAKIEKEHEKRYKKLRDNIVNGLTFERKEVKVWECRNCGHHHMGTSVPDICPTCVHPKAYFEIIGKNY